MQGTVVLAALAAGRLLSVKLLGYAEHVSEYGVHWNFFATLLCLRAVAAAWRQCCGGGGASGVRPLAAALVLLLAHEAALWAGVAEYVLHAPRGRGLFSDNRWVHFSTSYCCHAV
jgi:glucosaminylphosphatidylinositol acyltransferase